MTRRLAGGLSGGTIDDPAWVVELAERFAARYEVALDAWDAGADVPEAWRSVFATICARRTSVLEDLVFPMAAHIVRDLPYTLLDVGLDAPDGRSRVHDFHAVNDVLGHTIEEVQGAVADRYARYARSLDRIGHRYDEILTNYGFRVSRGLAWYNAVRLGDPPSAAGAAAAIERSPGVLVREVMNPPWWSARLALRVSRWVLAHLRRWPAP